MTGSARANIGSVLALVSAAVFALNVAIVPLIYDDGGNIHAINFVRPLAFLGVLAAIVAIRRLSVRLPSAQLAGAVMLGGVICIEFYAVHSAVKFIPVALAVLIMYTYPLLVALVSGLLGLGRITWPLVAVLLVTFGGLVLALSAPVEAADWRGIALGFLAACGMCVLVIVSERTMAGYDSSVVMFWITASSSAVMLAVAAAGVPLVWPETDGGLIALAGATACYVIATSLLFVTVAMIGPMRFAVIDNTVPVWAGLFGFLLLSETLVPLQMLGMAIVIVGVITVQFIFARTERRDRERY